MTWVTDIFTICRESPGSVGALPHDQNAHETDRRTAARRANLHPHSPYEWWITNNDANKNLYVYQADSNCMSVSLPKLVELGKHGSPDDTWRGVLETTSSNGCFYDNSYEKVLFFYGNWDEFKKGHYLELDYTKYWILATEKWYVSREGGDGGFHDDSTYAPIKTYCQLNPNSPYNIVCGVN